VVFRLELSKCPPQRSRFVSTDALDEMNESGLPAAGVGGLIERVDHQTSDELIATVHRRIAMRAVIPVLHNEVLFRQALQHRHDRRICEVASSRQRLMHLANSLGLGGRPQMIHDRAFQLT